MTSLTPLVPPTTPVSPTTAQSSAVSPTTAQSSAPNTSRGQGAFATFDAPTPYARAVADQESRPELGQLYRQIDALNRSPFDARYQTAALVYLLRNTQLSNPLTLYTEIYNLSQPGYNWITPENLHEMYMLLSSIIPNYIRIREMQVILNDPERTTLINNILNNLNPDVKLRLFLLLSSLFSEGEGQEARNDVARTISPENHLLKRKTYIQLIVCAMATGAIFTKALGDLATKQPLNMTTKLAIGTSVPLTALLGMSCYNPTRTAKYFERFVNATGNKIRSASTTSANFVKRNKKPILYTIGTIGACALAAAAVYGTICGVKKIGNFVKESLQSRKVETPTLDSSATRSSVEAITASPHSTIAAPQTLPELLAPETEGFTFPSLSEAQTMIEEKAHAFDAHLLNIPKRIREAYIASIDNLAAEESRRFE